MADATGQMLGTLAVMFVSSLACAVLPFFLRVKESQIRTFAALGAGLLIGSALAVIVPEGFHAFGEVAAHDHDHEEEEGGAAEHAEGLPEGLAGLVLVAGFLTMLLLDQAQHVAGGSCGAPGHSHAHGHAHGHGNGECAGGAGAERPKSERPPSPARPKRGGAVGDSAPSGDEGEAGAEGRERPGKAKKSPAAPQAAATDPQSAVTGLLIHCAADGLAMGAAFLSGDARLTVLIAAAMVMHKAPMAFGLATYLIACGWGLQRAQRTLVLFAAAAPAATLATYGVLGSVGVLSHPAAVALCVLFSGGTFLYAATMHILPEVLQAGGRASGAQLAAVVGGSLLPVALSWGHHH